MPDLNQLPVVATARQPRFAVKLNGTLVPGGISFDVDNNNFRSADTFSVTFAANGMPAAFNPVWLGQQDSITVEIFADEMPADPANYVPAAADSLIYGKVDDIEFDPVEGTVELTGRDLTGDLIDTRTSENHQNQTSSDVAILLAGRHGLTPVVTATTTRIGKFYEIDHTDINQEESEWDLLCKLADFEGFDVFVSGHELHFQPKPKDSGDRYAIIYTPATADSPQSANTISLKFSRSLTIAKGVVVEVRSWNAKQKKAFTVAWPKNVKATKPGQSTNSTQTYRRSIPGLTPDQATAEAKKLYAQIIQHMVRLTADMPADRALDCTVIAQVRGTGTAWDADYFPDSVRRSMSKEGGYRMTLSAKSISPDLEDALS